MRSPEHALTLIGLLTATACGEPLGPGREARLSLESVSAPATLAAATPLVIVLRYFLGACDGVTDLNHTVRGRVIEVEVRGRYFPPPAGSGCPDVLYQRDTTITVTAPPVGTVIVRGLQPGSEPLELFVQVSP